MASLTTIPRDDNKNASGINYVLLANYADVSVNIDSSAYASFDPSSSTVWTKFIMPGESSNWSETQAGAGPVQSNFFTQTLTLAFGRNDTVKRNNAKALSTSAVVAVVRENSKNNICLGSENGLILNGGTTGSGTAMGDGNVNTMVLTGNESIPYGFVTDASLAEITP